MQLHKFILFVFNGHGIKPMATISQVILVINFGLNSITGFIIYFAYHLLNLVGQPNARAPKLKAKARAGADVTLKWTKIVRMHQGPILAVRAKARYLIECD